MARTFYVGLMGLTVLPGSDEENSLRLGAKPEGPALLTLTVEKTARTRPFRTTGLYHIAFLFPDRCALGSTVKRLLQHSWPLQGTADHGVSEAIYLADPEGNGIELYIDRPRQDWPRENGRLIMTSDPLSLEDLLTDLGDCSHVQVNQTTCIGHIHLNVSDLNQARHFYNEVLGFEVTQDTYSGALFFAADGYHHHIGVNVWNGRNALPPPRGSAGLVSFEICVPDEEILHAIRTRLAADQIEVFEESAGFTAFDSSGICVRFTATCQ